MMKNSISWLKNWLTSSEFKTQILKGGGVSVIIQFGFAALSFVTASILARTLGSSGYGEYSNAQSWVLVLAPIATLGFNNLLVRNISIYCSQGKWQEFKGLKQFSTWFVLALSALIIPLVIGIAYLVFPKPEEAGMRVTLQIATFLIPFTALASLQQAQMRSLSAVAKAILPDLTIRPVLLMSGVIGLSLLAPQLLNSRSAAIVGVTAAAISVGIGAYWLHHMIPEKAQKAEPLYESGEWVKASVPFMLTQVFTLLLSQTSPILLGAQKDASAVGLFSAAYRVAYLMNFFQWAVAFIIAPLLASLYADRETDRIQKILTWSSWLTFLAAASVTVVFIIGGHFLLNIFGSEFTQATGALIILLIGNLIAIATGQSNTLLNMCGYQKAVAVIYAVTAGITIILNIVLIHYYSFTGAALASSIGLVLNQGALMVYARKKMNLNPAIL